MPSNKKICCCINDLSDYLLEHIFSYINFYQDFNNILSVNKRWYLVGKTAFTRMNRFFCKCTNFSWCLLDDKATNSHLLSGRCSHATCYHPSDQVMYMFGGCTNNYTAFNDLWSFDLSCRVWERIIVSKPPIPSAKALASLVLYNNNLILYGGYSKSSTNSIHQTTTFYKEIHFYNRSNSSPHLAGHTASIVGDFMLVFGGSMGNSYNNNIYVLDIQRRIWNMPFISGPCPQPRYGQSQIILDNNHLVIIGGCGGPGVFFSDVWLLNFDLNCDTEWKWTQLKVDNLNLSPPYLWFHGACKVGNNAVVISRPIKYSVKDTKRNSISNQHYNSFRISFPQSSKNQNSTEFCNNSISKNLKQHSNNYDSTILPINKKKLNLLRSHSPENKKNILHYASSSQNTLETSNNVYDNTITSCFSISKTTELHHAYSDIIVNDIPKYIVTSFVKNKNISKHKLTKPDSSINIKKNLLKYKESLNYSLNQKPSSISVFDNLNTINASVKNSDNEFFKNKNLLFNNSKRNYTKEVRNFYLFLIKEEHDRLKIVELAENLKLEERLNFFLRKRIPYLTSFERMEMITEFLRSNNADVNKNNTFFDNKGSLNNIRNRTIINKADDQYASKKKLLKKSNETNSKLSCNLSINNKNNNIETCKNDFGSTYYRRMCVYVLRLQNAIESKVVYWEQLPVEENAPEDIILYSINAAKGELILFGGIKNDGNSGMDCLNIGINRYMMNSNTYILRPRFDKM